MLFPEFNGADLSDDALYRYRLWRIWNSALPVLVFIGLNPSVADASKNDATIRWLIGYATKLGYGGIAVVNLFAWRATNPADLSLSAHPVQEQGTTNNDDAILITAKKSEKPLVICGWGNLGRLLGRDQQVLALLKKHSVKLHAIKRNRDGSPAHPLRNPHTLRPQPLD